MNETFKEIFLWTASVIFALSTFAAAYFVANMGGALDKDDDETKTENKRAS